MFPTPRRNRLILTWIASLTMLGSILGCTLISQATPTSTATLEEATAVPTSTIDQPGTRTAVIRARAQSTADAESTTVALLDNAATATSGSLNTATAGVKSTLAARNTSIAADLKSTDVARSATQTAQVESMSKLIQELKKDGILSKTRGSYHHLDDFDQSWAQMNWYKWRDSDHSPNEFVIRADVSWDSASDVANWFSSGCGFVFSEKDRDNHHLVFWGLDGNIIATRLRGGNYYDLGIGYYGPVHTPKGKARIMLVVENQMLTAFADGRKILRVRDPYYSKGRLGLTLLSGTNKGFGTRCQMTNLELWELE